MNGEKASKNERIKLVVLRELGHHFGKSRAIGMGELYVAVYGETWTHRINDTRPIRKVITELRREGYPILSGSSTNGGGYYLVTSASELDDYCSRYKNQALRKLHIVSKIKKVAMNALLGQLSMEVGES
jgi:hypothetical protein